MRQFGRRLTAAAVVALALSSGLSGVASAHTLIAQHGVYGNYGTDDSHDRPGAKCGYSAANSSGVAFLRWIKVFPPVAIARDVTGGQDHQLIAEQVKTQRSISGGKWKNISSSAVQTRTAYEDTAAFFPTIKVPVNGTSSSEMWRAVVTLSWKRNGSIEGWVRFSMDYYSVKWTVGSPGTVFQNACGGSAD